mmetsp:Transcript_22778/g.31870  ORF Transcript_22778/g.31870 Transcript_22778/m.31870 type:complete len:169 (-) Transcript_22778:178-684(-)
MVFFDACTVETLFFSEMRATVYIWYQRPSLPSWLAKQLLQRQGITKMKRQNWPRLTICDVRPATIMAKWSFTRGKCVQWTRDRHVFTPARTVGISFLKITNECLGYICEHSPETPSDTSSDIFGFLWTLQVAPTPSDTLDRITVSSLGMKLHAVCFLFHVTKLTVFVT